MLDGAKDRNLFEKVFLDFGTELSLINLLNCNFQTGSSVPWTVYHGKRTRPDWRTHYVIPYHSRFHRYHRHHPKVFIQHNTYIESYPLRNRSKDSNLCIWVRKMTLPSEMRECQWKNQPLLSFIIYKHFFLLFSIFFFCSYKIWFHKFVCLIWFFVYKFFCIYVNLPNLVVMLTILKICLHRLFVFFTSVIFF